MKSLFLAVVFAGQVFLGVALAGPITSGGGFAIVCRNLKGKIDSAELLDLYEARVKFGFSLIETSNDIGQDYMNATTNLWRLWGYDVNNLPERIKEDITTQLLDKYLTETLFLPINFKLPEINDLGLHAAPPIGCKVEQVAFFDDSIDKLKISTPIWNELDTLNQAALIYHEMLYRDARLANKVDTSVKSRAQVAALFSKDSPPAKEINQKETSLSGWIAGNSIASSDQYLQSTNFYYQRNQNILTLDLYQIAGKSLLTKTTVSFDIGETNFYHGFNNSLGRSVVLTDSTEPKKLKAHIQSMLSNLDMEIIFSPGEPLIARIYEDDKIIVEAPFTDLFTTNKPFISKTKTVSNE